MDLHVHVPAYDEGDYSETLDAIAGQDLPSDVSLAAREVWVTPKDGATMRTAERHPSFTAREAPDGFVSTLNRMHNSAAERGADAFIKIDADAPPRHDSVFRSLIGASRDDRAVAVNSRPLCGRDSGFGVLVNFINLPHRAVFPYLHGQCHLMKTSSWQKIGPYDETIDQTDSILVWLEVEKHPMGRLLSLGEVPKPEDAVVKNDTRRHRCQVARRVPFIEQSAWCDERGEETFAPQHPR